MRWDIIRDRQQQFVHEAEKVASDFGLTALKTLMSFSSAALLAGPILVSQSTRLPTGAALEILRQSLLLFGGSLFAAVLSCVVGYLNWSLIAIKYDVVADLEFHDNSAMHATQPAAVEELRSKRESIEAKFNRRHFWVVVTARVAVLLGVLSAALLFWGAYNAMSAMDPDGWVEVKESNWLLDWLL